MNTPRIHSKLQGFFSIFRRHLHQGFQFRHRLRRIHLSRFDLLRQQRVFPNGFRFQLALAQQHESKHLCPFHGSGVGPRQP